MKYHLDITIPGVPPISCNKSHGHWSSQNKERKKWRNLVVLSVGYRKPDVPFEKINVTFIRSTWVESDFDNLVSSLKSCRDGLVDAGVVVNDKTSNMPDAKYEWRHSPRGKSYVRIIVEAA